MKIGFIINPTENWLGGVNYYRNLFYAVRATNEPVELVVFTGVDPAERIFNEMRELVTIVHVPWLKQQQPIKMIRKIQTSIWPSDWFVSRLMKAHTITTLSHGLFLARVSGVATIGWMQDFQHCHYPHFFTRWDLFKRHRIFRRTEQYATTLLFSSQAALLDAKTWYGSLRPLCRCLPFISWTGVNKESEAEAMGRYAKQGISRGHYFFLPNQYWKHKNHLVVLRALIHLKKTGGSVTVVSTGKNSDERNPEHFSDIETIRATHQLHDSYRYLGVVSHGDVLALMKNSVAVINPSLFEGWSTTVEEAKSLGKKLLLSDIPVHREQAPERGHYFPPEDDERLAALMVEVQQAWNNEAEEKFAHSAQEVLNQRIISFGREFIDIVRCSEQRHQGGSSALLPTAAQN
jgi:glycosyltransferase involved in cell wall biosynthesis